MILKTCCQAAQLKTQCIASTAFSKMRTCLRYCTWKNLQRKIKHTHAYFRVKLLNEEQLHMV